MKSKAIKNIFLIIALVSLTQSPTFAIDDVWGGMGLTEDAMQENSATGTIFDKYNTDYSIPSTSFTNPLPVIETPKAENEKKSPSIEDLAATSVDSANYIDKEHKPIREIELYGLNSIPQSEILSKMQMKVGEEYTRDKMQTDLKEIYDTGFFTEHMKAVPTLNSDGTVTVKIIVEENLPVKDFTIEGNTVIPTEDILATLTEMKGKPQNIAQINKANTRIIQLKRIHFIKSRLYNG